MAFAIWEWGRWIEQAKGGDGELLADVCGVQGIRNLEDCGPAGRQRSADQGHVRVAAARRKHAVAAFDVG